MVHISKQLMCEDTGLSYAKNLTERLLRLIHLMETCPTCKGLGNVHDRG